MTPGEIIGHGSMCSEEKKVKPVINVVKNTHKDKTVTDRLWSDLKMQNNEVLNKVPELKSKLYSMMMVGLHTTVQLYGKTQGR